VQLLEAAFLHDIFISYSTLDSGYARDIQEYLERNGIPCWIAPRDIPSGSNYTKEIPVAIKSCRVFLLLLTKNAQQSQWVLKELDSAVNERKVIIPMVLDDSPLSDEFGFLLSGAQRHPSYPFSVEVLTSLKNRILSIVRPESDDKKDKEKNEWIPVTAFTNGEPLQAIRCPACGSGDVTELPKKIRRHGDEWITFPLILFGASFAFFLGMGLIFAVLYSIPDFGFGSDFYSLVLVLTMVASLTGGGWLGDRFGKEIIRRRRVRQHRIVQEFRCNACAKKFYHSETTQ